MGRSPAKRQQRWDKLTRNAAWEKRKVQLKQQSEEEWQRKQQLLQQEQLAVKKAREKADQLKNYHVRQHQYVLAQLIELKKERKRQENVPPSPRLSPRTCPPPAPSSHSSPHSSLLVLCAVAG